MFDVHIGERRFACLRVFDLEREASDRDVLVEAYVNLAGRTVLLRRYNGSRAGPRETPRPTTGGRK